MSALGWMVPLCARGTRPLSQQQARSAASQTGQRLSLSLTPGPGGPENRPGPRYSKYARGLCYSECGLQTSSTWEPVSNARPHLLNQNLQFNSCQVLCKLAEDWGASSRFFFSGQLIQGTCG